MSPSDLAAHEKREFASEIKFLLAPAAAERIRHWAREHLVADPHARDPQGDTYAISSIYFDTAELDVFHRRGRHRHSKFRIRRYGGATYFFERKLKIRGRLAKRRTAVTPAEAAGFAATEALAEAARWFPLKVRGRRLQPQCQIDYVRLARVLMTPAGPIRLTLDENVRAIRTADASFRDTRGGALVTGDAILELKYRRELPALFRQLIETFALSPTSFSKYRSALPLLGVVPAPAAADPASDLSSACQTS